MPSLTSDDAHYERMLRARREHEESQSPYPPGLIFVLAQQNPVVAAFFAAWRHGDLPSWNAMLIGLVQALAEQNEKIQKQMMDMALLLPPKPVCQEKLT